jgi:hypothetical protein
LKKLVPRIRGKVGVIEEPLSEKGKYAFSVWVNDVSDQTEVDEQNPDFGPFGPFKTQRQAKRGLERVAKIICQTFEKRTFGKTSGKYLDLKNNLLRRFDKLDMH